MSGLALIGFFVVVLSVAGVLVGVWYLNQHPYAQVSTFFTGRTDPLYSLAQLGVVGGILLFLVGVVMLVAGLVQKRGR
jgi:hypothetical protein